MRLLLELLALAFNSNTVEACTYWVSDGANSFITAKLREWSLSFDRPSICDLISDISWKKRSWHYQLGWKKIANTKIHIVSSSFLVPQLLSLMSMCNEGSCPTLFWQTIPRHPTATQNFLRCSFPKMFTSAAGKDGGDEMCASLCFFWP